jgi:outer membrane protein assembly factor BamB
MKRLFVCCCLLVVATVADPVRAENWPQFRGPGGLGVSEARGLPVRWSATENIAWKTNLPGPGSSSPIVWGDRIFVTCYSGYGLNESDPGNPEDLKRRLLCIQRADGKILWDRAVDGAATIPYDGFQALHGYASSTPATDGTLVFVFFDKEGVFAFDFNGQQVWRSRVGQQTHSWGSATSPVLYENLVIVNACVEDGSLVALDRKTGKEAWRARGMQESWSTPLLVGAPGGKRELVVSVEESLLGFDPGSGEKLWQCRGIQDYVCPSTVAAGDTVYAIGGRQNTALAVKVGGRGEVEPLWTQQAGSNVSSPVVVGDYLYWVSDRGIANCLNRHTGEVVYQKRLPNNRIECYASALAADGKIYNVMRSSGTFVLGAKPEFEQLANNVLDPDRSTCNASPAVADGQLLLRSNQALYCIGRSGR